MRLARAWILASGHDQSCALVRPPRHCVDRFALAKTSLVFLSDFARRLNFAALTDDVIGMERHHLTRAGIVAALGLGIALLSSALRIYRLAFEVAVGLVLLAALGLTWLVIRLRKF